MIALEILFISFIFSFVELKITSKSKQQKFVIKQWIKYAFLYGSVSFYLISFQQKDISLLDIDGITIRTLLINAGLTLLYNFILLLCKRFAYRINNYQEVEREKELCKIKNISAVLFSISAVVKWGFLFLEMEWSGVAVEQIIVNMTSPTAGTEISIYLFGFQFVLCAIALIYIFCFIVFAKFRMKLKDNSQTMAISQDKLTISVVLVIVMSFSVITAVQINNQLNFRHGFNALYVESDFIEENYTAPNEVAINFPENKRNLIFIYLESIENTYLSRDYGGYMEQNLMPELTHVAEQGVVFSDTEIKFGGPQVITGTTWSLASMVNQTSGLPLKYTGNPDVYSKQGNYLKNTVTLGDILHEQGYEQTVMIGASAVFGGLDNYYKTHGDYKVFDYEYAKKNGYIPNDYKVWWGYEDDKLYEFAKEEIMRLYKTGKPFNFTMENADTHASDGYLAPDKPRPYQSPYANAIAYSTAQVANFIGWIQEQPFYKNTTIVLIGDHLSMDRAFFNNVDSHYHRSQFNVILNADVQFDECRCHNRQYSNMDMFPTTLAALGCKIEGDKLGLGTNLFSEKDTLLETYGTDFVHYELTKKSVFYNETLAKID